MVRRTVIHVLLAGCLAAPALAQDNGVADPLGTARELYASARYDEALAVLNEIRSADRRAVEQYRSLCLLALGRTPEAEAAIAALITADPSYQPSELELSPRVRTVFTEVRQRLLPEIATSRYTAAKATYDRKEWKAAEQQFRQVLSLLDHPDMGGRMSDLRTLASGFMDLAIAAAAPPPPSAPDPQKIYSAQDAGVVAPVAVRQQVPSVPTNITAQVRPQGRVEVVIDMDGRVTLVTIRQPMHPFYDQLVLSAAREWRYRPATFNGVPVKYRKTIGITVAR
jgi:TonB family protein